MKEYVKGVFLLAIIAGTVAAIRYPGEEQRMPTGQRINKKEADQQFADDMISSIKYIEDPRTKVCIAAGFAGHGFVFAVIPQEDRKNIPPELLLTGRLKE